MKRMNLDSLTDIVSNSIGMLILFSLITLTQGEQQVYSVEVPIEHNTKLAPVFFFCRQDRLTALDLPKALEWGMVNVNQNGTDHWFELGQSDLQGMVSPSKGLFVHAPQTAKWDDLTLIENSRSFINKSLSAINPEKQFAFFFVYDDPEMDGSGGSGFESYRKARDFLSQKHIQSGWLPVSAKHPAQICFWSDVLECRFQPSHN